MKSKIIKIAILFIIFIGIICCRNVYAAVETNFKTIDYTDEYKEYMTLSDEEKKNRLEPSRYDVISPKTSSQYFRNINNILNSPVLLQNALNSEYDLRDIISNNVAIKNQMQTNSCWAFASIGSLESNIALLDYKAGTTENVYDFSERHMDYATRNNVFNNGEINEYGYNVGFDQGGTFYMAQSYLTNGMGAIDEEEMPFENNENNVDISEIQNKNTTTTLYDTIMFEDKDDIGITELMSKMKQVISNYGGIYAGIHGAQLLSDVYNNKTGAIYCSDAGLYPMNHAVVIIGWDDTYSKDNFNEKNKPLYDGAWIVKNSWGDKLTEDLIKIKEQIYSEYTEQCNERGWNAPEDIDNNFIIDAFESSYGEGKVRVEQDKLVVDIGDSGYMYVSYEDVHIYNELYAIEKATATKDYDNIYQNNKLNPSIPVGVIESGDVYIANKFTRDSNKENELLTMVSIFTIQEVNCKVYVNPSSNDLSNLQEVELEAGDTITIEPGYHTIMLKEPVKLTGDTFAVAMSIQSGTGEQNFMIETKDTDENVEVNSNESFYTTTEGFRVGQWIDLNTYESEAVLHGNVSIKAFTEEEKEEPELTKIEITTPPNKLIYTEGEDFDDAGMVVLATYSDLSTKEIMNYNIENGDNLYYGQESITISYTEDGITKKVVQNITVNPIVVEKEIRSIEVLTLPTKTTYMENEEELNLEGGVVRITYTDDSIQDLKMNSKSFIITGFNSKVIGKQNITIEYEGFTTTFEIEILEGARPILSNLEEMKTSLTDASIYLYYDMDEENYVDMSFKIDNIKDRDADTDYTYYYYLSESDSEENIENWTKLKNISITENEDGTYTMTFKISTKDMINYEELSEKNPDELYIYLKEIAKVNDESLEQIKSNLINADNVKLSFYKDNVYVEDIIDDNNPIVPPDNDESGENSIDNTVAPNPIPQTGIISIGIVVIIIAIFSIYFYIKHKNIDK